MPKFNFVISDELKSRMDGYEGVNWSQVARSSVERYLDQLDLLDEAEKKMSRLEASRRKVVQNGVNEVATEDFGISWATDQADYPQLRRLVNAYGGCMDLEDVFRDDGSAAGVDTLWRTIDPDGLNWWSSDDFVEDILGMNLDDYAREIDDEGILSGSDINPAVARGIVKGAIAVWEKFLRQ
jgi:hypothetical protein